MLLACVWSAASARARPKSATLHSADAVSSAAETASGSSRPGECATYAHVAVASMALFE